MRQSKKQWKAQWNGHFIAVENWCDWRGRTETWLFVDGVLVQRNKGSIWSANTNFESKFEDENGIHCIKVKVSEGDFQRRCHIYLNGKLIGGDTNKEIALTEAEIEALPVAEQRAYLKRQIFYLWVVMPAILFPIYCLMGLFQHSPNFLAPFFQILAVLAATFPFTLRNIRKLRKLTFKDNDKNPTSV